VAVRPEAVHDGAPDHGSRDEDASVGAHDPLEMGVELRGRDEPIDRASATERVTVIAE
jgi:hypothetical protein